MRNIFEYYSENDYLAHWGIKGQKWGIRRFQNVDGSLTPEGMQRYGRVNRSRAQSKVHKIFAETKFNDDISDKVFSMLNADKKYLRQARELLGENTATQREITKEVDKLFADLRSDENMHVYEAASEMAAYAQYGRESPNNGYFKADIDEFSLNDFSDAGFMACLEDGQQSDINAYSMYASKHNLEQKVNTLMNQSIDSSKNAREGALKLINEGLSEVGAAGLTASPKNNRYTIGNALVIRAMNSNEFDSWKDTSGAWYLDMAGHGSTITKEDKQNIDKAERYVRKLDKATDANTWWYVREAAENLGISSTTLKNMSQSDWDRVNAEIRKLRNKQ